MKRMTWLALLAALLATALVVGAAPALATSYHTISFDGDMSDWQVDEVMETDGTYTLYLTWDATNLYLGLTGATLGDDPTLDKSFFACFDTNLLPGSGATADGYGNVSFNTSTFAPEYCYYWAGGGGWYEWSSWDGTAWVWNGWRNDGTYYNWSGNPAPIPGSELTVLRSDIGNPAQVAVAAWLTPEQPVPGPVEAAWPTPNGTGAVPALAFAYHFPSLADGFSPNASVLADHVLINEFRPKGTEWVEIYNPTAAAIDITGWYVDDADCGAGTSFIPPATLPAGGYYIVGAGAGGDNFDLSNDGDWVVLCTAAHQEINRVAYGIVGGAPLSHQYSPVDNSTARTPNGTDTGDYARDWNVDVSPTSGAPNDAPAVALGSSLVINEYQAVTTNGQIELYNPTTEAITVTNWLYSDGDMAPAIITSTAGISIAPGGFFLFTSAANMGPTDVINLFQADGTRVDQVAYNGHTLTGTPQRVCDGEGPNDGYTWLTSGGDVTWFDLPETLGSTNVVGPVDMVITKVGPESVAAGQLITYFIAYNAEYPIPAGSFAITDVLPAGLTYLGYTADPPLVPRGATPPAWDGAFECGSPRGVLTVTVQTDAGLAPGTVLVNEVEIATPGDVNPANDTASWDTVIAASEIGVAKSCPPSPVLPGDVVTYTIGYNVSADPAQNVVITDVLPLYVNYVGDNSGVTPAEPVPGTLVWSLGTLPQSGSFVVTAAISTDPMTWTFTNQVWLTATNDGVATNNYDACASQGPMPIDFIEYTNEPGGDGTYPSLYAGQYVYVIGVVTADSNTFGTPNTRYTIRDGSGPWTGLLVFNLGDHPAVAVGDRVLLGGEVDEYNGMTELNILNSVGGYQEILSSGNPVPVDIVTTADITPGLSLSSEQWEAVLVQVNCAEVTAEPDQYGQWGATDASGEEALVDDWAGYSYVPVLGDELAWIQGVLFYSYGLYVLEPRGDDDIAPAPEVVAVTPEPDSTVCVNTLVAVQFDMAMDPVSLIFDLTGPGGAAVPGTLSYDPGTLTAMFTPDAPLQAGSVYTAAMWSALSQGGVPMCSDTTWSFATASVPEVTASAEPAAGCEELVVTFSSSVSGGLEPFQYAWTFGDGGSSTQPNPVHTYAAAGEYTASLVVTDTCGQEATSADISITVYATPLASFTYTPTLPLVGQVVTFTNTGDAPVDWWNFGDGTTGDGEIVTHTYAVSDTYTVTLWLISDEGCTASASQPVTVMGQTRFFVYLPLVMRNHQ